MIDKERITLYHNVFGQKYGFTEMRKVVIKEFCKDAFADLVFRLIFLCGMDHWHLLPIFKKSYLVRQMKVTDGAHSHPMLRYPRWTIYNHS